jgi:hypothetical protein
MDELAVRSGMEYEELARAQTVAHADCGSTDHVRKQRLGGSSPGVALAQMSALAASMVTAAETALRTRPSVWASGSPPVRPQPGCRTHQAQTGSGAGVGRDLASADHLRPADARRQGARLVERGLLPGLAAQDHHGRPVRVPIGQAIHSWRRRHTPARKRAVSPDGTRTLWASCKYAESYAAPPKKTRASRS